MSKNQNKFRLNFKGSRGNKATLGVGIVGVAALTYLLVKNYRSVPYEAFEKKAKEQGETVDKILGELSNTNVCPLSNVSISAPSGQKVSASQIELPDDYAASLDTLRAKYAGMGADAYLGKIEYYLKDALADVHNGAVFSGNPEDTTAYGQALAMQAALKAFDAAIVAGYSGTLDVFLDGCCGMSYTNITVPSYQVLSDGSIVAAPGARIYDGKTDSYFVWDDWGGPARRADERESLAYDMISNGAYFAGQDELNMMTTRIDNIATNNSQIEEWEKRLARLESGGPSADVWGDADYMRSQIDLLKGENARLKEEAEYWEGELSKKLGDVENALGTGGVEDELGEVEGAPEVEPVPTMDEPLIPYVHEPSEPFYKNYGLNPGEIWDEDGERHWVTSTGQHRWRDKKGTLWYVDSKGKVHSEGGDSGGDGGDDGGGESSGGWATKEDEDRYWSYT